MTVACLCRHTFTGKSAVAAAAAGDGGGGDGEKVGFKLRKRIMCKFRHWTNI